MRRRILGITINDQCGDRGKALGLGSRQNRELACITISHAPRSSAERRCDVSDLRGLAAKGSGSADILKKMLIALSVDPQALAKADPAVMRDLQRLCNPL